MDAHYLQCLGTEYIRKKWEINRYEINNESLMETEDCKELRWEQGT